MIIDFYSPPPEFHNGVNDLELQSFKLMKLHPKKKKLFLREKVNFLLPNFDRYFFEKIHLDFFLSEKLVTILTSKSFSNQEFQFSALLVFFSHEK